ncbi:MAG: Lrp/AsnC family transcriptional regulator [Granulosicoccaceae bacterium]
MEHMSAMPEKTGTPIKLDNTDKALLRELQLDASQPMDRLAKKVGVSKTAAWNRVQKLHQQKVIQRQVVIVDPQSIGLNETFFIAVKTNEHKKEWLQKFNRVMQSLPAIVEVHRLAGDIDYLIKVQVESTREFDELYKAIVAKIELYSVTSSLSMEVLKHETALPL